MDSKKKMIIAGAGAIVLIYFYMKNKPEQQQQKLVKKIGPVETVVKDVEKGVVKVAEGVYKDAKVVGKFIGHEATELALKLGIIKRKPKYVTAQVYISSITFPRIYGYTGIVKANFLKSIPISHTKDFLLIQERLIDQLDTTFSIGYKIFNGGVFYIDLFINSSMVEIPLDNLFKIAELTPTPEVLAKYNNQSELRIGYLKANNITDKSETIRLLQLPMLM